MKEILILNFRRLGDIYSMAHIINSLHKEDKVKISLLVYKESYQAAKNLANVNHIYTIDRKKITTVFQNPIFDPAHALDLFDKELNPIRKIKWDRVANLSNDHVGSYLTSHLTNFDNTIPYVGVRFSNSNSPESSCDWAHVYNDILPCFNPAPINFVDCQHQMFQLKPSIPEAPLTNNIQFDNLAKSQMQSLRDNLSQNNVSIVGVQLKTSSPTKDIPFNALVDLIDKVLDNPKLYPVLLCAPFAEELNFAKQINSYFDDRLVVIEADLQALASVLQNIDFLITPDTVTKHIADLLKLPTLEVSLGEAPYLKQGTRRAGNLILRSDSNEHVSGQQIYDALRILVTPALENHINIDENLSLYLVESSGHEFRLTPLRNCDLSSELTRAFANSFLLTKLNNEPFQYPAPKTLDSSILNNWVQTQKNAIAESSRSLLHTIREFMQLKDSLSARGDSFVRALDQLLTVCEKNNLVSIPLLLFRGRLESLPRCSFAMSASQIEPLLFELKDDFQLLLTHIKDFQQKMQKKRIAKPTTLSLENTL